MGPFDSEKIKGTFNKDISKVRQNDVWSSATINNFVETVYNLFRMESAYRLTYKNSGQEIGERLLKENPDTNGESACKAFAMIPDLHFSVKPADGDNAGYIQITPAERPAPGDADDEFTPGSERKYRLFYGTGDVSADVKPYSMFRYQTASGSPDPEAQVAPNYCIITYRCGTETSGLETPKYSRTAEIVCIYDPSIEAGNTVITVERASDKPDLPPVKFTCTFGRSVKVKNFTDRLNGLVYGEAEASVFEARLVGDSSEADNTTLFTALFSTQDDPAARHVRVLRFVPVRSCISFEQGTEPETQYPVSLENLTGRGGESGTISITEYEGDWVQGTAVFRHTGTYGFIIRNKIEDAPCMEYASSLPMIYIPNKVNTQHYEPVVSESDAALPSWYAGMVSKGLSVADTAEFSSDYFFVPYITVTDRTLEIAGFIIDIDTLLTYEEITAIVIPGPYTPKLVESNVTYDAWWAEQHSGRLYQAADQVYRKYRKGLYSVYLQSEADQHPELKDLSVRLPRPNSLVRTLQMITGLTWQLNTIVWIDPMLAASNNGGEDMSAPALKMFSGYDKIFEYEDTYSGPGSILTPDTTVIYLDDGSVFPFSLAVNNIDRLPSGLKHICFTFDDPDERLKITDTDFTLDGATLYSLDLVISRDLEGTSVDPDDYRTVYFTNQDFSLIPRLYLCRPDVQLRPIPVLSFSGGKYRSLACDVGVADTVVLEKHVELSPTEAEASIYGSEIHAAFLCLDDCGDIKCSYEPGPAYWRTEYGYDPCYLFLLRNINGSAIDLRLVFRDIATDPGYIRYKDMRNKALLRSVVGVAGEVKNSRITFNIVDKKNMYHSWVAPDGETTYPIGTWQAFDPDIFLPNADGNDSTFPDTFMFIDCGLFSKTGQGRLVNCELNVDLSDDFTRREPLYTVEDATQGNKRVFRCRDDSQFFASRMFRKSPYIFYFGDRHPYYYGASSELTAYDYSVLQSEKVDFKIFFSQPVDRMAVRYDITESPVVSPSIPSIGIENEAYMLTKQACRSFISGLKDSSISLPTMFMPAVAKSSFPMASGDLRLSEYLTYQHDRYAGGFAVSLLECVTGCTINLGILDTTFPLQDEWKYSDIDYADPDTRIYWAEPAYGFQFFTYPRNMEPGEGAKSKYPDMIINRNNHLYVAEWITRQTISGIYGLYDSEVRIGYSFTTQSRSLKLEANEQAADMTSGLLGPIRWDLRYADPGALHHKQDFIPNGKYDADFYYLPATPLFYLAEVCSCDVHLELSTKDGWRGTSPLGGTRIDPNDIRSQYYNNPIPNFEPSAEDKRRSLRLVVGYVLWLGGYWPVLAPSSYNTIKAHITRANLIAGMMNKVSGWCYRLVSTRSKSFTPERYHSSDTWDHTDIWDPQGPLLGDLAKTALQPGDVRPAQYFDDQAILDPDNRSASPTGTTPQYLGTLKPSVVTKELAFDCTAAGRSVFEPAAILAVLSFLHADYPVLGTSLLRWSDTVNTTMNNTNAVAYAPSCEWGHSGYTIMFPGYKGSIDNNNVRTGVVACPTEGTAENAVKGYAGRIPEPSKLVLVDGESGAPLYTWTQEPTNKFDQKTPMVNALNVADLDVLQIATDDIDYINPLQVTRAGETDPTELFEDKLGNLQVKQGQLLHTVVAQGWWFTGPDPNQY